MTSDTQIQVRFQLNTDDCIAFVQHWRTTRERWLRVYLIVIVLLMFSFGVVSELASDGRWHEKLFAIMLQVVIWLVIGVPLVMSPLWLSRRDMRRKFDSKINKANLDPQTLTANEQGLRASSQHKSLDLSWEAISSVEEDGTRIFLLHGPGDAIIVPVHAFERAFDAERFVAFAEKCRARVPQAEPPQARRVGRRAHPGGWPYAVSAMLLLLAFVVPVGLGIYAHGRMEPQIVAESLEMPGVAEVDLGKPDVYFIYYDRPLDDNDASPSRTIDEITCRVTSIADGRVVPTVPQSLRLVSDTRSQMDVAICWFDAERLGPVRVAAEYADGGTGPRFLLSVKSGVAQFGSMLILSVFLGFVLGVAGLLVAVVTAIRRHRALRTLQAPAASLDAAPVP